jgi:hypothetical protein
MNVLTCVFCKQPITNMIAKFRHEVRTANFMVGLLPDKEEMCDVCYTRAKSNPPTKEEVDDFDTDAIESAKKMRLEMMKF